jgi:hypothetical protein
VTFAVAKPPKLLRTLIRIGLSSHGALVGAAAAAVDDRLRRHAHDGLAAAGELHDGAVGGADERHVPVAAPPASAAAPSRP